MNTIHVWEKYEIILTSEKTYDNPYMEVEIGIRLRGPAFNKKVYGFWMILIIT